MAVTCGYFNSIDGDRKYNAETMSNYFEGLISNGVYNTIGDKFQVTAGDEMSVNVGTGRAMISCRWIRNTSLYNVTLAPSDTKMQRYDAIVLRLNLNDNVRDFTIEAKTGENSLNNPTKPNITNTELVKELCLAFVHIEPNAKSISQKDIIDMRGSAGCNWVTGLIQQVDTSTLFSQFETAYNDLYQSWSNQFDALLSAKKLEFEKWFSALENSLNIHLELKTYQNIVQTDKEIEELNLGIPEYETGNLLVVTSNGLTLVENLDYTVSGEGATAKVKLLKHLETDNVVTFTLIKGYSVDNGSSPIVAENQVTAFATDSTVETYIGEYTKEEEE